MIHTLTLETGRKFLEDRGYRFVSERMPLWRLPHSLYHPTQLELRVMKWLKELYLDTRPLEEWYLCRTWGWSQEALGELRYQSLKPLTCRLGLHRYKLTTLGFGPRTAIEMHERSGAVVSVYQGEWETCIKCSHQHLVDNGIAEQ